MRRGAQANRYIATETASRHHRFLLRENEVPNRRGQSAELRSSGDLQREVSSPSIVARLSPHVLATNVVMVLVVSALKSLAKIVRPEIDVASIVCVSLSKEMKKKTTYSESQ